MSHEKACPPRCSACQRRAAAFACLGFYVAKKKHHPAAGWCGSVSLTSGFLRCGLARRLAEIMVVRHARTNLSVEEPAHRALGEYALRFDDFLPHRVLGRLLRIDGVEHLELLLQHGVGRPVGPHLGPGLQPYVVLPGAGPTGTREVLQEAPLPG